MTDEEVERREIIEQFALELAKLRYDDEGNEVKRWAYWVLDRQTRRPVLVKTRDYGNTWSVEWGDMQIWDLGE